METEWRNTPTPEFSDDGNWRTRDPIPWPTSQDEVSEFTDTGVLIPYKEFLNCNGFELVESLGDAMEDRFAAEIFRRSASDYITLTHLAVLGMPAWIVCRTRSAYLRFVRDWIGRLVELNREDTIPDLTEAMDDFLTEAAHVLNELRKLSQPAVLGKRHHRGSRRHPKRAQARSIL